MSTLDDAREALRRARNPTVSAATFEKALAALVDAVWEEGREGSAERCRQVADDHAYKGNPLQHARFLLEMAICIANHCAGVIEAVGPPQADGSVTEGP